jgi:hypothetical protein
MASLSGALAVPRERMAKQSAGTSDISVIPSMLSYHIQMSDDDSFDHYLYCQ